MLSILFLSFLILLILGMPIGYVMAVSATLSIASNSNLPGIVMAQKMFTATDSFSLMAIPFFMLAGHLMTEANITQRILDFSKTLVGHITGGLAQTTVMSGMLMAGISGSGAADASAIGGIMVPSLTKDGYDEGFAVSLIASCAALGPIIPPSIIMIMYSSVTNISVGKLFLAGVFPGIVAGIGFMGISYFYARKNGFVPSKRASLKVIGNGFVKAIGALIMPIIIMGGILSGIFTATESGAIACVYGLIYGLVTKSLTIEKIKRALLNATLSTVPAMFVIAVASIFGFIMARENFSSLVLNSILQISDNAYIVLFIVIGFLVALGMFVDTTAAIIMVVPVLVPLIGRFGYDPLHFAIIIVITLVLGALTPPVGMLVYIVAGVKNTPTERAFAHILPFVIWILAIVTFMVFFPKVVLFIPNLMS
ncbi:TRAP transporter large permease [Serpentinicella alkaliphila]|uniref:C4-dicarboxylate transporter DctM subunit n=1 Tax=Serpentinicella alkaliphila TaxID=1734049 RepID=A0A4R2TXW2_9FIRM|nr:TRAP transporter large permease [Serpentinicella alkaliphila]QUH26857.1 TRAP transporter large permease [Serpentinicella alkaliphila]TCQ08086.1 C4-dicarboxylate transporter DctM subunit [Serpentinicella alkaliphila]